MLKLFNFISELMESKLKPFSCQAHLGEYIARAALDTSLELRKSLPNFTSANADTSEGVPDEIKGFLSSESDY